jgi:hypothetical protein
MPKRKENTETITTQDQEGTKTTLNKTNRLGVNITRGTRTPKGAITTNTKGRITTLFEPTSLVPFAMSMAIIPTISLKLMILNR